MYLRNGGWGMEVIPSAKSGNYEFRLLCKIFSEIPNIKGTEKDVS